MKATGLVRYINPKGRICLSLSALKMANVNIGNYLEIFTGDGGEIVLQKYKPYCAICGQIADGAEFRGRMLCAACISGITGLVK